MAVSFKRFWAWEDNKQTQDINHLLVKMAALGGIFDTDTSQYYASSSGFTMPLASGGIFATAQFNWATGQDIAVPADYTLTFNADVRQFDGTNAGGQFWAIAVNIPVAANPSDQYLFFTYESDKWKFGVMSDATKNVAGVKYLQRGAFAPVSSTTRNPRIGYTVSVRQLYLNNDLEQLWAVISVYRGRKSYGSYAIPLASELRSSYIRFGQALIGSPVYFPRIIYSNIAVKSASETIESAAVDPGEAPMGGIQRAYEGLYLKYWMRPNFKFKLMRPGTISSSATITSDRIDDSGKSVSFDNRALRSHIRMAGAYTEAEYISETVRAKIGYRFEQVNNPYLLTPTACYVEAIRYINRLTSEAEYIQFSMPMNPLLEYEDRITVDDEDWVIQSIEYDVGMTDITMSISARRYVPDA